MRSIETTKIAFGYAYVDELIDSMTDVTSLGLGDEVEVGVGMRGST